MSKYSCLRAMFGYDIAYEIADYSHKDYSEEKSLVMRDFNLLHSGHFMYKMRNERKHLYDTIRIFFKNESLDVKPICYLYNLDYKRRVTKQLYPNKEIEIRPNGDVYICPKENFFWIDTLLLFTSFSLFWISVKTVTFISGII